MSRKFWEKIKKEFEIINEFEQWIGHSEINFESFKSLFRKQTYWEKCKSMISDSLINIIGAIAIMGQIALEILATPIRLFTYPIKKLINHIKRKNRNDEVKRTVYKFITKNPFFGVVGIINKGITLPVIAVGFVKKTICTPIDNLLLQKLLEGNYYDKNNKNGRKTERTR